MTANPIELSIEIAGSQKRLANALGVTQQSISNWASGWERGVDIHPKYCVKIEGITNGCVTRKILRPHDWQTIWPELAELRDIRGIEESPR